MKFSIFMFLFEGCSRFESILRVVVLFVLFGFRKFIILLGVRLKEIFFMVFISCVLWFMKVCRLLVSLGFFL